MSDTAGWQIVEEDKCAHVDRLNVQRGHEAHALIQPGNRSDCNFGRYHCGPLQAREAPLTVSSPQPKKPLSTQAVR